MEQIAIILTSPNAPFVLGFLAIIIIALIIVVKNKWLFFKGHGLQVGVDSSERTRALIQSQFEYANAIMDGSISDLPKDIDIYRAKYVIARAEDVMQKAIIFNNMTKDPSYIRAKQSLVYQAVRKRTDHEFFKTPEFKEYCDNLVEKLIFDLVDMKTSYLKE